ncbi:hypothetical protein [Microcella pacifica]|uniref:Uncharacterized protein n=1 Tax=Microcella pacifica TaxID=2591847 RepID=A0A9E5MDV9_9MICO|nr:hypothetical protein [Microcella pacifica]NHF61847.1 hypothetical protein [Microcella pacifica]
MAGIAIATGATLGGVLTFVTQLATQLSLPSAPTSPSALFAGALPFALFVGLVGLLVGAIVAAAASVGATAVLLATRRRPIRQWLRPALAGLGAGITGMLPLAYIFLRPGWVGGESSLWVLGAAAALIAAGGVWLCERRQMSSPVATAERHGP